MGLNPSNPGTALADKLLGLLSALPATNELIAAEPLARSRQLATHAAMKAAAASSALALPPGPLGMLTILPDLVLIWRIQAQMVADIAAVYGKQAELTREHMIYCLFKHAASQAVRDLTVRMGTRLVVRVLSHDTLKTLLTKIGIRLTERVLAKSAARWIPILGAAAVGAYAYYDTTEVAKNAIDLFSREDLRAG